MTFALRFFKLFCFHNNDYPNTKVGRYYTLYKTVKIMGMKVLCKILFK